MASLLQSTVPISHHRSISLQSPPSSSSSTISCYLQQNTTTLTPNSKIVSKRNLVCRSSYDEATLIEPSSKPPKVEEPDKGKLIEPLKLKLLSAVAGLNRGLVANEEDLEKADGIVKEMESIGGIVDLTSLVELDKLQGKWKLVYSSAFSSRTLGGSRPGPSTRRLLPITPGQVFQRIDILSKDFDNIVQLELGTPWPIPPIEVTATLAHKFELLGSSKIRIMFEKTTVKATGNLSQLPPLEIPQLPEALRPSTNRGSGEFEVTYLDSDFRITRGDRDELRVFVIA